MFRFDSFYAKRIVQLPLSITSDDGYIGESSMESHWRIRSRHIAVIFLFGFSGFHYFDCLLRNLTIFERRCLPKKSIHLLFRSLAMMNRRVRTTAATEKRN